MILTLEIVGAPAGVPEATRQKVFHGRGGTIGRLPENDLVLPHPYVSSRHALIRYVDGAYVIEDMSRNGVFVNSLEHRLQRGQPYTLQSGDRLIVDPYEIQVSLAQERAERADPFQVETSFDPPVPAPPSRLPPPAPSIEPSADDSNEVVDPLKLLGFGGPAPAEPSPRAGDLARGPVVQQHFRPPARVPDDPFALPGERPADPPVDAPRIPDHYDPLHSTDSVILPPPADPPAGPPPPRPTPGAGAGAVWPPGADAARAAAAAPPPPRQAPPPAVPASGDLADMLAGAGLEGVAVTPELARQFGAILRIVVAGVMDVLQARQRLKEEFRINTTVFRPADNNPLKFSANVEDALHNLLVKRNAAYLGPVEAFAGAFDDVRDHQMALLAGVRTAYEAMLGEFDPERLQERFDRQSKRAALVAVPARLRYWDLYCERFHDIVRDPDTTFRELFGEEFAVAYEEQLARLKAQRGPK